MKRIPAQVAAVAAAVAAAGALASAAPADPTQHFGTFTIACGGNTIVIVSKPGSSNVVTFNGEESTSVSILFGYHLEDASGNVIVDFHKPVTEHMQLTTCTDTSVPPGFTGTAETLITPAH
ncbi:MAG: hypothetical protein LC808_26460 [Actinobacteria bacterium]|nr:hypothetical protein [Actinomycetota bacterium]